MVAELRSHNATREIFMFGDEPWVPNDRVQLSYGWPDSRIPLQQGS